MSDIQLLAALLFDFSDNSWQSWLDLETYTPTTMKVMRRLRQAWQSMSPKARMGYFPTSLDIYFEETT